MWDKILRFVSLAVFLLIFSNHLSGQAGNAIYFQNLTFDSHGDFIYCGNPDYSFTNQITVAAWVKWTTNPGDFARSKATHDEREGYYATYIAYAQHGATNVTSEHGQFWLRNTKTGNNIQFTVENAAGTKATATSSTTPVSGTWYFLAGTYDGSNVKLYINGTLESTVALTGNIRAHNTDCRLDMGRLPWGYGFFVGYLDEVRVWNTALSQSDIQSQMNSKSTVQDTYCKSYWNFDAGSGTTITDSKGLASGVFYSALIDVHSYTTTPSVTISDNDRSFVTNAWNGKTLKTVAGAGVDETNTITSNSGNVFTLNSTCSTTPVLDGNANMTWFGVLDASETSQWVSSADLSLPVELTSFSASVYSGNVFLSWSTESETENLGFIIQRRPAAGEWKQVASYLTDKTLEGHGSTSEKHEYQYTDKAVVPGATYLYRLGDVDYGGEVVWYKEVEVKIEAESARIPEKFGLQPVYPNPFNPALTIPYGLTEDGQMTLKVYNLRGELIEVLKSTYALKGTYSYTWQPQELSAGIYFISLQSGNRVNLQKVVFVK